MPFLAPGVLLKRAGVRGTKGAGLQDSLTRLGAAGAQWGWLGFQVPPGGPGRHQKTLGAHPAPVLALRRVQIKVTNNFQKREKS